jgi:hypothetical protein
MTRQLVTALVVAFLVLCLPNLLWVSRSTAVVRNNSQQMATDVRVNVGSAVIEIGTLAAGACRFLLLPAGGDATLNVVFRMAGVEREVCGEYVEGSMYHVRVILSPDLQARCETDLPLFSRLLVMEWLR